MRVILPMCGESRRFREAGYEQPKYMLPLWDQTVLDWVIAGFRPLAAQLVFVVPSEGGASEFVRAACQRQAIDDHQIIALEGRTAGQAETVERGLGAAAFADREPMLIFNVDTFRVPPPPAAPSWLSGCDGYLEVFQGRGAQWSFVEPHPGGDDRVARTTEKDPISDLCSSGLYYFREASLFLEAVRLERARPQASELYVAPLYNHLIRQGRDIRYQVVTRSSLVFCGVPDEYENIIGAKSLLGERQARH